MTAPAQQPEVPEDDLEMQKAFEACAIAPSAWTHHQHLRLAWVYLSIAPEAQALERMKESLMRFNRAAGTPESLERGYHETITRAWMRLVACTVAHHGAGTDSRAFLATHPHLAQKTLLRLYYTRARLISAEAKARFVEPDIAPLPA